MSTPDPTPAPDPTPLPTPPPDEPPAYDPETMGRPEDGEGLTRHRLEDGPDVPDDAVILVPPERGPEEGAEA